MKTQQVIEKNQIDPLKITCSKHRNIALRSMTVLALLGAGSPAAFAEIDCTRTAETIPITMPASITVRRDMPNGTVLSPWVPVNNHDFYTCYAPIITIRITHYSGMAFRPMSLTKTNVQVKGSGPVSYTVWDTNVPGVGIAIGTKIYTNGCAWEDWSDLGTPSYFLTPPWQGFACNSPMIRRTSGAQIEVALVKTGPVNTGTVTGGVLFEGAPISGRHATGPYTIASEGRKSFLVSSTAINVAACSTANVTVGLGSHKQSRFTGIGSTTPAVAFNVGLSSCPGGLNAIQYQFIPLTAALDSSNGVLALSADSTASGIGVQVKDRNGSPLKYNTPYTLASYNTATGGTYSIPLTAAYYQTSRTVRAGSANSLLTFTMSYQ